MPRGGPARHRPDGKPVCIARVVSQHGILLGAAVVVGNRAHVTTLQEIRSQRLRPPVPTQPWIDLQGGLSQTAPCGARAYVDNWRAWGGSRAAAQRPPATVRAQNPALLLRLHRTLQPLQQKRRLPNPSVWAAFTCNSPAARAESKQCES